MLKKIFITVLLISTGNFYLYAQCCGTQQKMIQQITASPLKMYYLQNDGTPFLSKNWNDASLTLVSGESYDNLKVKIDLYKDDLIYFNQEIGKQLVIDKNTIKEFRIKIAELNREYLVRNVNKVDSTGKPNYEFYFIHVSDSISLWSTHRKKEVQYNDISNLKGAQGYYYDIVRYFIVINGSLVNMPSKKRKLAKFFPAYKKEIITFINRQKLNLDNDFHLSILFARINELEHQ